MFNLRRSVKFLIPISFIVASFVVNSGAKPVQAGKNTPTPSPTAVDNSAGGSVGDGSATPVQRMTLDLTSDNPQDVIAQLQALNLIPQGGIFQQAQALYVTARTKGPKYLPIFTGITPADMVLQFSVQMDMKRDAVKGSGCGFFFRLTDTDYAGVLLTIDRHLILSQYQGKTALVNFDQLIDDLPGFDSSSYKVTSRAVHIVTIVAVATTLSFFLDGVEVITSQDSESVAGNLALLMYNVAETQQSNTCTYKYVWFLDLSNA